MGVKPKPVMDGKSLERTLKRLASEITERVEPADLAFIGVHTRGVHLAKRLKAIIDKAEGIKVPMGTVDINLYRDDLTAIGDNPMLKSTDILFDMGHHSIVLVDDVLFTGRTIRAALNALADLGRPKRILLAVLADRGGRELPIQPDFCGARVEVKERETVHVHLAESDGRDEVVIEPLKAGENA